MKSVATRITSAARLLLAAALLLALPLGAQQPAPKAPKADTPRQLILDTKPWTGDFDGMLERRLIRVLRPL